RRQCDRPDSKSLDLAHELSQAALDVLKLRRRPPMLLGGKVDDELRLSEATEIVNKHFPDLDLLRLRGRFVLTEVGRERLLELKRDALAHHAYGVDRVH